MPEHAYRHASAEKPSPEPKPASEAVDPEEIEVGAISPVFVLNMAMVYVTVTVFANLLDVGLSLVLALAAGYASFPYYHYVSFYSTEIGWSALSALLVYLPSPLVFGGLAVFLYDAFYRWRRTRNLLKAYFLWGAVVSANMVLSNLLLAALAAYPGRSVFEGLGAIFKWLHFPDALYYPIGVLALALIALAGSALPFAFLKLAPSQDYLPHKYPRAYLLQAAVVPFALGATVRFLAFPQPPDFQLNDSVQAISLGLMLLTMLVFARPRSKRVRLARGFVADRFSPLFLMGFLLSVTVAFLMTEHYHDWLFR